MTEVVRLDVERARRRGVTPVPARRSPAPVAPLALMWRAVGTSEGHRRIPGRGAACGALGTLVLAEPGVQPCRSCYPLRGEA